jgi:hypothetical protein
MGTETNKRKSHLKSGGGGIHTQSDIPSGLAQTTKKNIPYFLKSEIHVNNNKKVPTGLNTHHIVITETNFMILLIK